MGWFLSQEWYRDYLKANNNQFFDPKEVEAKQVKEEPEQ